MKIIFSVEDLFIIEPLGLMQLVAIAKNMGHETRFLEFRDDRFLKFVRQEKPDMVAFSIMSISSDSCIDIVKKIKEVDQDTFIFIGGPHPTYFPDFIRSCEADAICVGEGDLAFAELLKALEQKKDISRIRNIHTRRQANPPRDLIEDLDGLPYPDRDLVYQNSRLGSMKLRSFMATRGCAYSCAYCFNSGYKELYRGKGKILRRRSVDNLLREIKTVRSKYPIEMIRFGDDVFIEKMDDWLLEFSDKYPKTIQLPFYCLLRPDIVTPEIAQRLKKAGCACVSASIETGNEKIRREVLNRKITNKEILNACQILNDQGIKSNMNIMLGLPHATLEDEMESMDLAFESRPTSISFTIFTPFQGTELHRYCVQKKILAESDLTRFPKNMSDYSVLDCFTQKEKNIQKNIFLLGTLAYRNTFLKKFILKHLIFWPSNRIFFYISFLTRNYYFYRFSALKSLSMREFIKLALLTLRHDKRYIGSPGTS